MIFAVLAAQRLPLHLFLLESVVQRDQIHLTPRCAYIHTTQPDRNLPHLQFAITAECVADHFIRDNMNQRDQSISMYLPSWQLSGSPRRRRWFALLRSSGRLRLQGQTLRGPHLPTCQDGSSSPRPQACRSEPPSPLALKSRCGSWFSRGRNQETEGTVRHWSTARCYPLVKLVQNATDYVGNIAGSIPRRYM